MNFEEKYAEWLEMHRRERRGAGLRRLEEGHAYLEKLLLQNIWWPAFGSLEHLYPEYEVRDYNDGRRFIDHAYKPDFMKLAIEADGFNPHVRDIGRWEHADNLLRDAHLIADGWTVLHFSKDIIIYRARQAQQLLRQIVWGREGKSHGVELSLEGREVIRYARIRMDGFTPVELCSYLKRSPNTVRKVLSELLQRKLICPVDASKLKIRKYELTSAGREIIL